MDWRRRWRRWASEYLRVEGVLKQNGVKKAKLEKARSESVE